MLSDEQLTVSAEVASVRLDDAVGILRTGVASARLIDDGDGVGILRIGSTVPRSVIQEYSLGFLSCGVREAVFTDRVFTDGWSILLAASVELR